MATAMSPFRNIDAGGRNRDLSAIVISLVALITVSDIVVRNRFGR
jgi:hypothetical protein